jgi:hypothetical protein
MRDLRQNIKILKTLHVWGLAPENYQDRNHHWRDEFSVWYQYKPNKFSPSIHTGRSCSSLTSAVKTGVQMGEMSRLGWLIPWSNICEKYELEVSGVWALDTNVHTPEDCRCLWPCLILYGWTFFPSDSLSTTFLTKPGDTRQAGMPRFGWLEDIENYLWELKVRSWR